MPSNKLDVKLSKQLRYYYNHKQARLAYQRHYRETHREAIKQYTKQRYHSKQVQTILNTINVLCNIRYLPIDIFYDKTHYDLWKALRSHTHGRPRQRRKYDKRRKGRMMLHITPEFGFNNGKVYFGYPDDYSGLIKARTLIVQLAHFLGFKYGDSMVWKENNPYHRGRIDTHTLCFDGSGLDMSHKEDLDKLVRLRLDTGLKGNELLCAFTNRYSIDNYLQVWRGNTLLMTSEIDNAWRSYQKLN